MNKQKYFIEARRVNGAHTFTKSIFIRSVDAKARTYERAKKLADQAARRGYDAKVTHFEYGPVHVMSNLLYEVSAVKVLPWKGAE